MFFLTIRNEKGKTLGCSLVTASLSGRIGSVIPRVLPRDWFSLLECILQQSQPVHYIAHNYIGCSVVKCACAEQLKIHCSSSAKVPPKAPARRGSGAFQIAEAILLVAGNGFCTIGTATVAFSSLSGGNNLVWGKLTLAWVCWGLCGLFWDYFPAIRPY